MNFYLLYISMFKYWINKIVINLLYALISFIFSSYYMTDIWSNGFNFNFDKKNKKSNFDDF
jgi:hypothetical protein